MDIINAFIVMEKTPDGKLEPYIYQEHPDSCGQYLIIKDENEFQKFLDVLDDSELDNFELKKVQLTLNSNATN
jgi:hypothetical protein